jgi:hypothetical protein
MAGMSCNHYHRLVTDEFRKYPAVSRLYLPQKFGLGTISPAKHKHNEKTSLGVFLFCYSKYHE